MAARSTAPRILRRPWPWLAAALLLTACADLRWARPGTDAAAAEHDLEQCRQQAELDARHMLPPRGAQPSVAMNRDGSVTATRRPAYDTDRFLLEQDFAAACMRKKGYQREPQ